jgi:hypothetical protein
LSDLGRAVVQQIRLQTERLLVRIPDWSISDYNYLLPHHQQLVRWCQYIMWLAVRFMLQCLLGVKQFNIKKFVTFVVATAATVDVDVS